MKNLPYRIAYVPDPICWTEAPESLKVLRSQRTRWQRGLAESLTMNISLLCHPRSGSVGWLAFPFFLAFEMVGPVVEVTGYLIMATGWLFGLISWEAFETFMFVALTFGILLSVTALLLEELSFRLYPRQRQLFLLFLCAIIENFGYRQLIGLWRLQGLLQWLTGARRQWGTMTRTLAIGDARTDSDPANST